MSFSRVFLTFQLLLLFCFASIAQYRTDSGYSGLYDSETVTSFKEHVGYVTSEDFEGRKAGSEGEKAVAEYVYDKLAEYGVDMLCPRSGDEFGIAVPEQDTLTSRNIYGFIQGYDKSLSQKYIVIGARMDNLGTHQVNVDGRPVTQVYAGANGNASGLAMMLELARMVSTNSVMFRRSVIFVGFGASSESFAGAWYFLNRAFPDVDKIDSMINLDMLGGVSGDFYAYTSSNTDLNSIVATLTGMLQPVHPKLTTTESYPSDHRAFYAKEIPSVFFTSGQYSEHNSPKDVPSILNYELMEKELEYIYNFSMTLANTDVQLSFRNSVQSFKGPSYDDVVAYYDCDQRPMFLNSADPYQFLSKWVYQYLKYPPEAVRDGIQGTVQVNFIVDKDGSVTDVSVGRSIDPLLDDEAVRVISASPKWKPGRLRGQKVRTSMTIPVEFRLEKKGSGKRFGIKKY